MYKHTNIDNNMKLSLQKRLRKNRKCNSLCLKKRRKRRMMKQSSQVEKKDLVLKDTEILDAEKISHSMDLEVTKEDKKRKRKRMKQSSQVEKKDLVLKETEILDAEEISHSMDLEVTKEDKKRMMMEQSSQVEKKDLVLKDTEIDAEEISDSMDLEVTKEDKKMKGIMEGCCEQEDLPKFDLSISKRTSGEASSASCHVCMAVLSISDFSRAPDCNHRFCKDCIETYLLKKIQEDAPHVVCPESKCKEVLKPGFCRKFIPEELFDRWQSELNLKSSKRIVCPNYDCEEIFMDDGKGYKIRACPKCWNLICMPCGQVEWHMEEDCETFRKRRRFFFPFGPYGRLHAGFGKQHDFDLERKHGFNTGILKDIESSYIHDMYHWW